MIKLFVMSQGRDYHNIFFYDSIYQHYTKTSHNQRMLDHQVSKLQKYLNHNTQHKKPKQEMMTVYKKGKKTHIKNVKKAFHEQFCHYFASLFVTNQANNVKPTLTNFLGVLILERCIFLELVDIMEKKDFVSSKDKILKYFELKLIDVNIRDRHGYSLAHRAAACGDVNTLQLLLNLDSDIIKQITGRGDKSPLDIAIKEGQWEVVKTILLCKKGSKIKNLAKETELSIASKEGIVCHILDEFEDNLMEQIVKHMTQLLEKQLPLSDDILFSCWKYESRHKKELQENRIWCSIEIQLKKILDNPQNHRGWYWFELYIWNSAVKLYIYNKIQEQLRRSVCDENCAGDIVLDLKRSFDLSALLLHVIHRF